MTTKINCPQCNKPVSWQGNSNRPFCSERCRLLDLGRWADGSYRIAGKTQDTPADENVVHITDLNQDLERS
jgi:endogenous inhibitor of DNA gyrase (YacG/DUF329 family)